MRLGKAATGGLCVFTGLAGCDGAHLFPAGDFPQLADCEFNIFAVSRDCHSVRGQPCFDWKQVDGVDIVRPVSERIWMLHNMIPEVMWDYQAEMICRLLWLNAECNLVGVEYPEPVKPSDYFELRLRGREC